NFPYEMGEKIDFGEEISPWTLYEGKKINGGEKVSIFICDISKVGTDQGNVAKADYKRIKTTRHPNVLKYIDGLETDGNISLVTEHVVPLIDYVNEESDRNEYEISWGLYQILKIASFLNIDCKIIHNNITINSIFVDKFGDWKLGGFGFAHNNAEPSTLIPTKVFPALSKYKHYFQDEGKTECWSNDIQSIGSLIWELFNGPLSESSSLSNTMKIPKLLITHYRKMISPKPHLRPSPRQLIDHCRSDGGFMKNSYVDTNLFLEELQLKDTDEKTAFFKSLNDHVDEFPVKFCKQRLLPQLINAFEFGGAGSAVLQPLIKIGRHLTDEEYQEKVIPCIIKLFSSPDRSTRINLLQQMEFFAKYLNPKVVDSQIYPQLATGFTDTVPALREETIKSMVLLVPKLSESTISKDLLKHFAILQQDEQSSIRTNTTICLGKVACHFSEATRQRVLATAFLRAMQDPFPPARIAGILGFAATKSYYSQKDIAEKILPNLCSKTLDSDKSVRDQIFASIRQFLAIMESYSEQMKREPTENGTVNDDQGLAATAAGAASSWAGWAVNSLASKIITKGP
ncbi:uncharacterized protein TRIADDRAFT_1172, partial [Trichoplax adhaerens]